MHNDLTNNKLLQYIENREDLLLFINKFIDEENFKISYKQNKINQLFNKVERTLKKIKLLDSEQIDKNNSYSTVLKFLTKLLKPYRKTFISKDPLLFNFSSREEIILDKELSLKIDAILEILHNVKIFPEVTKNIVLVSLLNILNNRNLSSQDFYLKELILEEEPIKDCSLIEIDNSLKEKLSNKQKLLGQVFTPIKIVVDMLDEVKYKGVEIVDKYVLEPSFGDGNFLSVIVERYINSCEKKGYSKEQIRKSLNKFIYGVELDPFVYQITKDRLNNILKSKEIEVISWDNLYNMNTMNFNPDVKFDFILGNPPYVSAKNLDNETKKVIESCSMLSRNSDLYVYFYVKCSDLLAKNGRLIFITPNNFLKLPSLKNFRNWLKTENLVKKIENFKQTQIFDHADVCCVILYLEKDKTDFMLSYKDSVVERDFDIRDLKESWVFPSKNNQLFLEKIENKKFKIEELRGIKGSAAIQTGADQFFIVDIIKELSSSTVLVKNKIGEFPIEKDLLSPVLKASKLQLKDNRMIIFPFKFEDDKYVEYTEEELVELFPRGYDMFLENKKMLEKRTQKASWYSYSNNNISRDYKLVFKHYLDLRKGFLESEIITDRELKVYGGFYFQSKDLYKLERLKRVLDSNDFSTYAKLVGKDLSSTFNSILLKQVKDFKVDFNF